MTDQPAQFETSMDVAVRSRSRRTGRRFVRVVTIVAVVAGLALIALWPAIDAVWLPGMSPSKYNVVFHTATAGANRVVIRDGGMDCCGPVDGQAILYEITDPGQVREFREHIQIAPRRWAHRCRCCGYPGIDWYVGKQRVAITAIGCIPCLRWAGFRGDVFLTDDSYRWLENWMEEHHIPRSRGEKIERRGREPPPD